MLKKCNRCREGVENVSKSTYYAVLEFNENAIEKRQIFYCTNCWYYHQESNKYLNKPHFLICSIFLIDKCCERGDWKKESEMIQNANVNLIKIYKEVESKYNGNIDLNELAKIKNFRDQKRIWLYTDSEKSEKKQLETKYNLNSSNTSDISPLVIGSVLGGLLVIIYLAYLLSKKRNR